MEKERKYLQLTAAEYLIRVNEIRYDDTQIPNQKIYHLIQFFFAYFRGKKGVNLLQQMLEYYKAQYK